MNVSQFRHTPIVEKERLVGLVSSGDAIKYHLNNELEIEQSALDLLPVGAPARQWRNLQP